MKTVNFTEMKYGSKDDYLLLDKHEQKYIDGTKVYVCDSSNDRITKS